jgi:hypothetical protein
LIWLLYLSSLPCQSDPSCGSEPGNYNSTFDFGPRKEHAPVAYLSFLFPTILYMSINMHKIHSLKSERKVRIAGSATVYIYTINLGQTCESHRGMDFLLHCSEVRQISLQWALIGLSHDNKAIACLIIVPV